MSSSVKAEILSVSCLGSGWKEGELWEISSSLIVLWKLGPEVMAEEVSSVRSLDADCPCATYVSPGSCTKRGDAFECVHA